MDNYEDQKHCLANDKAAPITIVQKLAKMEKDLEKDSEANEQTTTLLGQEEPTIAMYWLFIFSYKNPIKTIAWCIIQEWIHFYRFEDGIIHQYCQHSSDEDNDEEEYKTEGSYYNLSTHDILQLDL